MSVGFFGGKFLPLHQGHVNAMIEASTMVDKLYVVLSYSERRDKELCERDGCTYIPPQTRLSWLHQVSAGRNNIIPLGVGDEFGDEDYDWAAGSLLIKARIPETIDAIFGSEPEYKSIFATHYPGSSYVLLNPTRNKVPICATEIRQDPLAHWEYLPNCVRPFFVKKIAILGTESCGKSTLVKNLAGIYNTTIVEEYGREVCESVGGPECLIPDDYRRIAYGHKLREHEALQHANKLLFIDTEALVTKYYAQLYNNYEDPLFDEIIKHETYDLWLYLEPDVAWINDGQRQHGEHDVRAQNNERLKEMLKAAGVECHTIRGNYSERFIQAQAVIDQLLVTPQRADTHTATAILSVA